MIQFIFYFNLDKISTAYFSIITIVLYMRQLSMIFTHQSLVSISLTLYSLIYTTFTNFSMKYLVMCKVYTDVGGIK